MPTVTNNTFLEAYLAHPVTHLKKDDLMAFGISDGAGGYLNEPDAGKAGTVSQYENILIIANNGSDTQGNGSLLCPFASDSGVQVYIGDHPPSPTNWYLILDQRVGNFTNQSVVLLPYCVRLGNKALSLDTGEINLSSLFATLTADAWTYFGGYQSLGTNDETDFVVNFSFGSLPNTHAVRVDLFDAHKACYTGNYVGNDDADFNKELFLVYEHDNFNTFGRNQDSTFWHSNINISSGITRRIRYCDTWQISSVTKSLGSTPCVTKLDVAFCGAPGFRKDINTLAIINSGGANNQPMINIQVVEGLSGSSSLLLDITNDEQSFVSITTDITTGYYISSANSLVNISFQNYSYVDYQYTTYPPENYTKLSYDDGGFTVTTDMLGSQLKGIDVKLGALSTPIYPPNFISGLSIQVNGYTGYIVTNGVCVNSNNTFNMVGSNDLGVDITNPLGPSGLDTGSYANNIEYYFYLINSSSDPGGHPPALICSANPVSPSFANAAGYDKFRYLFHAHSQASGVGFSFVEIEGTSNERIYSIGTDEAVFTVLSSGNDTGATTISTGAVTNQYTTGVAYKYEFTPNLITDSFSIQGVSSLIPNFTYQPQVISAIKGNTPILPVTPIGQTTYFVNNTSAALTLSVVQLREYI